jgi:hypothetical protein
MNGNVEKVQTVAQGLAEVGASVALSVVRRRSAEESSFSSSLVLLSAGESRC